MTSTAAVRVAGRFVEASMNRGASSKKPLYGHASEATAYVVDDYPYGFKARTSIRYWLEFAPKKGWRFVSQTMNPKTQRWNAAKKSTYVEWAGAMYMDNQGHVTWTGVGQYTNTKDTVEFVNSFPNADFSVLRIIAKKKVLYLSKMVSGEIAWQVNGVRQEPTEHQIGEYREELEIWQDLSRKLH